MGLLLRGSHDVVVPVTTCHLQDEQANQLLQVRAEVGPREVWAESSVGRIKCMSTGRGRGGAGQSVTGFREAAAAYTLLCITLLDQAPLLPTLPPDYGLHHCLMALGLSMQVCDLEHTSRCPAERLSLWTLLLCCRRSHKRSSKRGCCPTITHLERCGGVWGCPPEKVIKREGKGGEVCQR